MNAFRPRYRLVSTEGPEPTEAFAKTKCGRYWVRFLGFDDPLDPVLRNRCMVCGLDFSRAPFGYACFRPDCPGNLNT